jgi:hypothetical protein
VDKKKYAYLIIAHNEFEVLQKLISALDDSRNDIYVHIDKKVKTLPELVACQSNLFVLKKRIDVRWGHVSQIESEYVLFEAAYYSAESYSRYILISGTHIPLKSQDTIHRFFDENSGREILRLIDWNRGNANFKLNFRHYFLRSSQDANPLIRRTGHFLWRVVCGIQKKLTLGNSKIYTITKANNWVALSDAAVKFLLDKKKEVLTKFRRSFCGDEYVVPYVFENSGGRFEAMMCENLLFDDFGTGSRPRVLTMDDYDFLVASDYLFARKFSRQHEDVIDKILETITK